MRSLAVFYRQRFDLLLCNDTFFSLAKFTGRKRQQIPYTRDWRVCWRDVFPRGLFNEIGQKFSEGWCFANSTPENKIKVTFKELMTAGILSGRRIISPFGLQGGKAGKTGRNWIERSDGRIEALNGTTVVAMQPNDILVIATPGGGAYGDL